MNLAPASIFTSNMVLQREIPVPIWGTAKPGSKITIKFANQEVSTKTGSNGKWSAKLKPLTASSKPRSLTIESSSPKKTITLSNVLVGEVWLGSGQSNMHWTVAKSKRPEIEIPGAQFPNIRLFTVPQCFTVKPQTNIHGKWEECSPKTVPQFSAVAYFFGRELHRRLKIPIGLIHSSVGGSRVEAWMRREVLETFPDIRKSLSEFHKNLPHIKKLQKVWQKKIDAFEYKTRDVDNIGLPQGWAKLEDPVGTWKNIQIPGTWQSRGLNFNGILWFRKKINIPKKWAGKSLQLSIGATDKSDHTYFNGSQVGSVTVKDRPDSWSFLRTYTIPGKLVKAGENVIAVRVHSNKFAGGMTGPAQVMNLNHPNAPKASQISIIGKWKYAVEKNYGLVQPPLAPEVLAKNAYSALFNGMIAPLVPFAIRGAIWYQGEANSHKARMYKKLFPTMIRDWRKIWDQGNFPFLFVQLANYTKSFSQPKESPWAELREAQTSTLSLPNTGMAVAIDIGEENDIHPKNKQTVGLRLARNALNMVYGKKEVVPCGPLFKSAVRKGKTIQISFDHTARKLKQRGKSVKGFAIAGKDRKFIWAKAKISGHTVIVSHPTISKPTAVRYAWANNPVCNLYNSENLPACPFQCKI